MGCGASADADRPRGRSRRNRDGSDGEVDDRRRGSEETDSDSDGSSETASDFEVSGEVDTFHLADRDAYKTQHMDKLWNAKVAILQSGQHQKMSIDEFCKSLGISQRDAYKALNCFEQICDETGQLRLEQLAQMVGWSPGKNLTMARIMDSFDEDRNGYVDFSEFLVLSKMFHGHFSKLDKARFWWWIALYTDRDSVMGGEREVQTVDRNKAETMMRQEARGGDRDGVQRVPTQTVARFLRDALMSVGQLRDGHKNKFQGTEFIANPAPSKVLNKVKAALRDAGLKNEQIVFHQFHDLIYHGHSHFGAVLDAMHNTLGKVVLSGSAPPFPGQLHLMKLRAFFYGKVQEYLELEEQYDDAEAEEKHSRSARSLNRWQHEFDSTPRTHRSFRSASSARHHHRNASPTRSREGSPDNTPRKRLQKAHTHHGREKTPREGPRPASEAMQVHKSFRNLIEASNQDKRYSPDKAQASQRDRSEPPRLKKGKTALQLQLADMDR